jgi:hypothetical protein
MNRRWDWWPDDEEHNPLVPTRGGYFREDLDVSDYVRRVEGGAGPAYGSNTATITDPRPYEPEQPMLFGRQDMVETSTCTDLAIQPGVIWDVNGYYRTLGIPFPHRPVTRRSLMRAYQAAGGENDPWTTYCFNQLLDEAERRAYDASPLGEPYMDDRWSEYLRNEAKKEVHRRIARGEWSGEESENPEARQRVLKEWNAYIPGPDDPPPAPPALPRTVHLTWSYYLWRCSYRAVSDVTPRLDEWRTLLVKEFRARKIQIRFCVGFLGKEPHPWMRIEWERHLVFFLNVDQVPTKEYAVQAAEHTQRELGLTPTM